MKASTSAIKEILKARKVTGAMLARGTNLNPNTISKFLRGEDIMFSTVLKIAEFLDVDLSSFVEPPNSKKNSQLIENPYVKAIIFDLEAFDEIQLKHLGDIISSYSDRITQKNKNTQRESANYRMER